jgi:large subunit ribosomal protein L29
VKAEDLRTLDADELTSRLKGARRELYELRFKHAVGQLDDHRQIRKVRKDIARILTVVHVRRLEGALEDSAVDLTGMDAVSLPVPAEAHDHEGHDHEGHDHDREGHEHASAGEPATDAAATSASGEPAENEETPENVEAPETSEAGTAGSRKTRGSRAAREEKND